MSDKKLVPTDEQEAIISHARSSESLMISAYAGCSKTTSLALLAQRVNVPALALAFNKRIADELKPRLPGHFQVKTLNGLGHQAWLRHLRGTQVTLDDRKLGKLVTQVSKDAELDLSSDQWESVRWLVSKAMQSGLSPGNQGRPLVQDDPSVWLDLAVDAGLASDESERAIELARSVLVESIAQARSGIISFDDQIYCPTILGGSWHPYPFVVVDESQDLSPLNHRMIELASNGRIVAVGDSRQAIYAFRGADAESMKNLRLMRNAWLDLPLTMTFRCPKLIVERQQRHAPGFRYAPSNAPGRFERAQLREHEYAEGRWSWEWLEQLAQGESLAILCRNNAPLLSLAFKLLRQSVPVVMAGRDIGKGLIATTRKLAPSDSTPVTQLLSKLTEWESNERSKLLAQDRQDALAGLEDRCEGLRAIADGSQATSAGDLRAAIQALFSRERGRVLLSSIHRAKGLEWNTVLHLDPWRLPSKQAKQAAKAGNRKPLEQEMNLRYVAETRTQNILAEANLEDFY